MPSRKLIKGTILCGLVALWLPERAQSPARLEKEIVRVRKAASSMPADDPVWQSLNTETKHELSDAQAALDARYEYLALEDLGKGRENLQAVKYMNDRKQIVGRDLDAFDEEWKRVHTEVAPYEKNAGSRVWAGKPAILRALSESAAGRAEPLLQGARAFSKVTDVSSSLYYLGEAKSAADFANFCYSLDLPIHGTPLALRSIAEELDALQARVNATFQPPRSIEKHPQFIRLNASLKLAKELNAAGLYGGALYQYLDAVQQVKAIELTDPGATSRTQLRSRVDAAEEKLKTSGRDDSIAELFLQKARFLLSVQEGSEPASDNWRLVDSLVDEVLPTYVSTVSRTANPTVSATKASTRVTLVRWPYT